MPNMQIFPKSMFQKSQVRILEVGSQGDPNLLVSQSSTWVKKEGTKVMGSKTPSDKIIVML